jgi:Protein affecting phage T7 exclusion by the F plasmid
MLRIIAVLLLIPLLDVMLLAVLIGVVGWQLVVLAVVLTALVGMLLVRAEGRHTVRKIQRKTAQGELPTDELLDGALLLVAGAFLVTPGLVTDLV